jgi:hypothetical protein
MVGARRGVVILITAMCLLAEGARAIVSAQVAQGDESAQATQGDGTTPPQQLVKPETLLQPEHTGWGSLFHSTMSDFAAFPKRKSTWVILGIGAGAAAIAYPFDDEINESLQDADALDKFFTPGKWLGYAWVQGGAAVGLYVVGRYFMEPEIGTHTNKVAHLGFDLLRHLVTQALTYGIKVPGQRDRPTGECCAFPSGHASMTFATPQCWNGSGYRASWPMFVIAGYVATSRLTDNRHFETCCLIGPGMAAGWTSSAATAAGHLSPVPVRGGRIGRRGRSRRSIISLT